MTSTASFEQTAPTPWPSGHGGVLAVLRTTPEELTARFSLRFFEGADNLDAYDAVAIRLRSGRRLGLLRHRGDPMPGVEVYGDAEDDPDDTVAELLQAFGMPPSWCSWVREARPEPVRRMGS